jgi:hypothetical protein
VNLRPATPTAIQSPYAGVDVAEWPAVTKKLVERHPLSADLFDVVQTAWHDVFATRIGAKAYKIGADVKLSPQIMAWFLHELIPLAVMDLHPGEWSKEKGKKDKDLVCVADAALSVEIKASSHPSKIFGNRSYAQPPQSAADQGKKGKSGYYLAINFEKFSEHDAEALPKLVQVRFGWLDHSDWIAQRSQTGQQAHVESKADRAKLIHLYPKLG